MAHPTAVISGTDAMAKMTAMLALVSRRKREIRPVMRLAGMARHLFGLSTELLGILPRNRFPLCSQIPFNFIDLGGGATPHSVPLREKGWRRNPRLVTVMTGR